MSTKQNIIKAIYPMLIKAGQFFGIKATEIKNLNKKQPNTSIHELKDHLNNGVEINFGTYKGKKLLIVNTASNCGYTPQFEELKTLSERYESLQIIGFPSNDFKEQEKGSDKEIATFCTGTFGIKFPLIRKSIVKKHPEQNTVFKWLSDESNNGWLSKEPEWNFSKYLIDETGMLTHYFGPGISPLSTKVIDAIEKPLS